MKVEWKTLLPFNLDRVKKHKERGVCTIVCETWAMKEFNKQQEICHLDEINHFKCN